ncbi:NAD(P)H-binding protein [Actinoallomurus spadix]|uniref:NAD(P)-binding domain-containing protein n=1 Tax=Actinoallomurus spadix TaxID=79912 RepID=A0ABN0WRL5_9ACTN|nr:NAD(P)H-binding protein [Actinoallomurus spadix]MCO5990925.1 NAD(P)H-binding protein [Actinoallomurus spadix]
MTVLVTGGRGAVARALIGLLRERGIAVRAASSRPEDPDTVRCDLTDPSTFAAALKGVTSVLLYAEPSHIGAFAEEAAGAGVEHIVLLSSSAVLAPDAADSPVARTHLDVENALTASAVPATTLRPGSFASNALAWSRTCGRAGRSACPSPAPTATRSTRGTSPRPPSPCSPIRASAGARTP